MRLALARSGEEGRRSVIVIYANLPTVVQEELHDFLVLVENLLQNFCGSCCSGRCWILRRNTVCHICLISKFGGEADHNVFHEVGLDIAGLFQIQFSSFGKF